jgi:predicted nucleic acid-binding protein
MVLIERLSMSFWDAMIWAVAKQNRVAEILSEDGPVGSVVEGIRYTNPFG